MFAAASGAPARRRGPSYAKSYTRSYATSSADDLAASGTPAPRRHGPRAATLPGARVRPPHADTDAARCTDTPRAHALCTDVPRAPALGTD
ncbi:hypothetical protein ABTX35_35480, partial [Streptomyces sp. NPDC096080]|uniref:hypothetical protein n=1 Tax=Streptomyces sp. NPDC096080 TaxID=3156693 RepID=UPI00331E36C3